MRTLSACLCLLLALTLSTVVAAERVRPSALAGTWYPADAAQLGAELDALLEPAGRASGTQGSRAPIRALILPHAGYRYSGPTAARAVARLRGREFERVLILAPAHRLAFAGLSIPSLDAYRTPLGDVPLDRDAIEPLRQARLVGDHPNAHRQEHSIEIELPLLQRALAPGWRLVPILVGQVSEADAAEIADLLRPLADARTLVLVSTDFTHYGPRFDYVPFPLDERTPERLHRLDEGALDRIRARDAAGLIDYRRRTGITICGIHPLQILLRMLPPTAELELVAYDTSGALTGDYRSSVSYASLAVTNRDPIASPQTSERPADDPSQTQAVAPEPEIALDRSQLGTLHRIAELGVARAVLGDSPERDQELDSLIAGLPEPLERPAGAFVTLKRGDALRGCIGYIQPREPLYRAVLENGYNAARRDPRFVPVAADELQGLSLEVSVLTPPRPIASYEDFEVGRQGVILAKRGRTAVFLPHVATEQGWSRDQTLSHLARKAGLPADAWRKNATFQIFESQVYEAPLRLP